jgi:chloramphenicol 3-O phosphotransferase
VNQRTGSVVVLNGASSAGKTSVARLFAEGRAVRGECWIVVGIDDFIAKLPWQWLDTVAVNGPFGADGLRFAPSRDGVALSVGDVGRRLFATYRRSVALWARRGFDVLVDEVCFDAEAATDWDEALAGLAVHWVALRCDLAVLEEREGAREDRILGLARGQSDVVHRHRAYDLELDSTQDEPADLAAALNRFVDAGRRSR